MLSGEVPSTMRQYGLTIIYSTTFKLNLSCHALPCTAYSNSLADSARVQAVTLLIDDLR